MRARMVAGALVAGAVVVLGAAALPQSRARSGQALSAPRADAPTPGGAQARSAVEQGADRLAVPPPPFTEGIFPCSACHASMPVNRARRPLEMHGEIDLLHDEEHRWCLDCHSPQDRDRLHLASGEPVPFEESYRLCGQCHGEKLRDWRAGVHGRRTGEWNGQKRYVLCAHCHDPHQPRFKKRRPEPAPERPRAARKRDRWNETSPSVE